MIREALASIMIALLPTVAHAETISLYAAGSLKTALTEIARAFEAQSNGAHTVAAEFAASGLLRARIEKGEPAHVFASANMEHPRSLADRGLADLQVIQNPPELAVGADYGRVVVKGAPAAYKELAGVILGPSGQAILAKHGFGPGDPASSC